MSPKAIRLHGHRHWHEHARDAGRCRFAKCSRRNIREMRKMLHWSKTKPNILKNAKIFIY